LYAIFISFSNNTNFDERWGKVKSQLLCKISLEKNQVTESLLKEFSKIKVALVEGKIFCDSNWNFHCQKIVWSHKNYFSQSDEKCGTLNSSSWNVFVQKKRRQFWFSSGHNIVNWWTYSFLPNLFQNHNLTQL